MIKGAAAAIVAASRRPRTQNRPARKLRNPNEPAGESAIAYEEGKTINREQDTYPAV
jgi:hypothetical protein